MDLMLNKDILYSISAVLSIKNLTKLRLVSKQFNFWLSDGQSFSWQKRIELAFPQSYQQILKEDLKSQMIKLHKFDSLVNAGHQVSFIDLSGLLDGLHYNDNLFKQIPWCKHQFIIVVHNTVYLFDSFASQNMSTLTLEGTFNVACILFDIQSNYILPLISFLNVKIGHIVGLLDKQKGKMKIFIIEDNVFKHKGDYESDFLCRALFDQIYGNSNSSI